MVGLEGLKIPAGAGPVHLVATSQGKGESGSGQDESRNVDPHGRLSGRRIGQQRNLMSRRGQASSSLEARGAQGGDEKGAAVLGGRLSGPPAVFDDLPRVGGRISLDLCDVWDSVFV
jgi:hypothetical protein